MEIVKHTEKEGCNMCAFLLQQGLTWWQLRNSEQGQALDCFKKSIEVTPAMAARLIQVLKAEVNHGTVRQTNMFAENCRMWNLW